MEKIHILGIAPFASICDAMERIVSEEFPDIELDAKTGDLEDGVKIARGLMDKDYDAIISRGGTAELLKKSSPLPVVEITFSVYDILRAIKMAENYNGLYAIVGFPSITGPAHILCDLLQYNTDIITVRDASEVRTTLERLKMGGYNMVVCDNITHRTARELGYSAFLITSGTESLHDAFERAVSISSTYRQTRRELAFLRDAAAQTGSSIVVFNSKRELFYSAGEKPAEKTQQYFRQRIGDLTASTRRYLYIDDTVYLRVTARAMEFGSEKYYVFQYRHTILPRKSIGGTGIYMYEKNEVRHLFQDSFLSISGAMRPQEKRIAALAVSGHPVMIIGETGTGKQQIAKALYLSSRYSNEPFVVVNCTSVNEHGWDFLLNSSSSPMSDNHITVYFQDIEKISYQNRQELLYYSNQVALKNRVFLIFSATAAGPETLSAEMQSFISGMECILLPTSPLRSRADEIPSLANLYLNSLNVSLGKQIIGFAPNAMDQLIRYEWPDNFTQFKKVLTELASVATSSYILNDAVSDILLKERTLHRTDTAARTESFAAGKTLDEIVRESIRQTMDACGGNQTLAAKQLGISRSTLWRHLGK